MERWKTINIKSWENESSKKRVSFGSVPMKMFGRHCPWFQTTGSMNHVISVGKKLAFALVGLDFLYFVFG